MIGLNRIKLHYNCNGNLTFQHEYNILSGAGWERRWDIHFNRDYILRAVIPTKDVSPGVLPYISYSYVRRQIKGCGY